MNKLLICKPHSTGREDQCIGSTSSQKQGENIAAVTGVIPDQDKMRLQHNVMEKELKVILGPDLHVIDFPDREVSSVSDLFDAIIAENHKTVLKLIGLTKSEAGEIIMGNIDWNEKNPTLKQKPVTLQSFFKKFMEGSEIKPRYKDSFIFVRDSFLSNQNDTILLSSFRANWRRFESTIIKEILNSLSLDRDIIMCNTARVFFEGGDFRFVPANKILFAGYNPSDTSRNNKTGIQFVQKKFGIKQKDTILIQAKNAFHIDTFFSVVTDNNGYLIGGIICSDIVENLDTVKQFFQSKGVPLYEIPSTYGIGSIYNGIKSLGNGAINSLNIGNNLISSDYFPDIVEKQLDNDGIKRIIAPTSEFWNTGGGVHCLTNQI